MNTSQESIRIYAKTSVLLRAAEKKCLGLCYNCTKPALEGRGRCQKHYQTNQAGIAKHYAKVGTITRNQATTRSKLAWRALGRCYCASHSVLAPGKTHCFGCLRRHVLTHGRVGALSLKEQRELARLMAAKGRAREQVHMEKVKNARRFYAATVTDGKYRVHSC